MGCWASRSIPTFRRTIGSISSGRPRAPRRTSDCRGSRSWAISSTWRLEKILLTFHTDRAASTNHEAGSLAFGPGGELYISTGDDTNPVRIERLHARSTNAPGRSAFDAQRSAGNTNDLRGKILRIDPQPDGTYTIPAGNLFPADGSAGRPEIFVMGNRNPFRISVDAETGWLYWGEVGPDASNDSAARGPRGYDEFNQARGAGNFGWPYVIANNQAYRDYNFATMASGPGVQSRGAGEQLAEQHRRHELAAGPARDDLVSLRRVDAVSRTGQRRADHHGGARLPFRPRSWTPPIKLPAYYDDTLFIYEWSRNWIKEVKLDASGNILKINPFAADIPLVRPMDMELGPDGALYVLEWGTEFGGNNADAQLVRIEFLGTPQIVSADFDENGVVDGADFLDWQRGLGIPGGATRGDGDANVDGRVDGVDLGVWKDSFRQPRRARRRAGGTREPPPLTRRSPRRPTSTPKERTLDHTLPMIVDDASPSRPKRTPGRRFAFAMPR